MAKQIENPDIATEVKALYPGHLSRVGMENFAILVNIEEDGLELRNLPANASAFVNLIDEDCKGIHMSRIFNAVHEKLENTHLDQHAMKQLLVEMIEGQKGLADSAFLKIDFQLPLKRKALLSDNFGLRHYPIEVIANQRKDETTFEVKLTLTYSSTCPCSAALARKLIQDEFKENFKNTKHTLEDVYNYLGTTNGIIATPHSQRSSALLYMKLNPEVLFSFSETIDKLEKTLKTPVQTMVKREDEQEFARLNGQNLMFCEDAARLLKHTLNDNSHVQDYWIKVSHKESLHAHDAVAYATKEVDGGYRVGNFL